MVLVKPAGIPLSEFRKLSDSNQNKLRALSKTMQQRWKYLDSKQRKILLSGAKPSVINDDVWSTLSKSNKEALTEMDDYDIRMLGRKLARAHSQPVGGGVMPPRVFIRANDNGIPLASFDTRRKIVKRMVDTLRLRLQPGGNGGPRKRGSTVSPTAPPKLPKPKLPKATLPDNSNVIGTLPEGHKLQLARAIAKVVPKSQQNILKMFDRFDISMLPIGVYNKGRGAIQVRPRYRAKEDQDAWYHKHFGS